MSLFFPVSGMNTRKRQIRSRLGRTGGAARAASLSAALLLALMGGACNQSMGDFGRAKSSPIRDWTAPETGGDRAVRATAKSQFNLADEEREMYDRVWRFLIAPHAREWMFDRGIEPQRTEFFKLVDHRFKTERYYQFLHRQNFQSSTIRFRKIGQHINADLDTLPATFRAVCAVERLDRRRRLAYAELHGGNLEIEEKLVAREAENDAYIEGFVRAVSYRFDAYQFALDRYLVETPHEEATQVNDGLNRLDVFVSKAKRYEFCWTDTAGAHWNGDGAIASRYSTRAEPEYLK
jgi:hypothetical protein